MLQPAWLTGRRSLLARPRVSGGAISRGVPLLCFATLLLIGSSVSSFRPLILGLSVHPFLFPVFALLPRAAGMLEDLPRTAGRWLGIFSAVYLASILSGGLALQEVLKLAAALFVFVITAVIPRSQRDLHWVASCFALALLVISVRGIWEGPRPGLEGLNPMETIGNKNVFSLFFLPCLLISGYLLLRRKPPMWQQVIMVGAILTGAIATFLTANRSGWLGVFLVGALLLSQRFQVKLIIVSLAGFFIVSEFVQRSGASEMIQRRIDQSSSDYYSDQLRRELLLTSLEVSFDHPFLGVSPQVLPQELARRLGIPEPSVNPHNVVAHLAGGSGLIATGSFFAFLSGLVSWSRAKREETGVGLVGMMVALWLFRGQFTHEILYSPTFSLGLGLAVAQRRVDWMGSGASL